MIRRLTILLLIVGCGTEPETAYKICIVNKMNASTAQDGGFIYCYPQTLKTECDDLNWNTTIAYGTFTYWDRGNKLSRVV